MAIAAVVATDIVCNVRHRAFLEEYCPSFGRSFACNVNYALKSNR